MDDPFLLDGPASARATILLAHGAGAPMDSAGMTAMAGAIASAGFRTVRFEFDYMASRRRSGARKPPPRAETLIPEYVRAIEKLGSRTPLVIGGKSMGGRVASMIADDLRAAGKIVGLLCLGYPFHPPNNPEQLRTAHLIDLMTPSLICQGTRDEFGAREEVARYKLSKQIRIAWFEDGDHDLKPRKSVSGFTADAHMRSMAGVVSEWFDAIAS